MSARRSASAIADGTTGHGVAQAGDGRGAAKVKVTGQAGVNGGVFKRYCTLVEEYVHLERHRKPYMAARF